MLKWAYLITAILLEVLGSLSLKGALDRPILYAIVAIGYIGAFIALFLALRSGMALGVGYGIWGASGVALTAVMSMVIYAEPITLLMGIGIVVVMIGVLLVEIGAQSAAAKAEADR